ncbi:vesicular inhibitory amino acid transporter-like [Actinia tenebrosa]|uniref:Vesicular inhibitory amino acid transporter-like n=1 Tax=Actinia tenebrosa TaxID=6105 RepID=A0A6P8HBP2_ACTTE|nr:vesicular inhibitory amino acid transporter-like [Actinia tenebrosa]
MAIELLSFKQLQTFNNNDKADMERTEADKNPRFTANREILSFDNLASSRNSVGASGDENLDDTDIVTVEEIAPHTTKMSSWKAAANFICDIEGIGLLSLPYAILKGGIASLIALLVVPIICHYTGVAMIECLYEEDNEKRKIRVRSTVEDLGEASFPKYGKKLVIILQSIGLLMVSTSYLVLSGIM